MTGACPLTITSSFSAHFADTWVCLPAPSLRKALKSAAPVTCPDRRRGSPVSFSSTAWAPELNRQDRRLDPRRHVRSCTHGPGYSARPRRCGHRSSPRRAEHRAELGVDLSNSYLDVCAANAPGSCANVAALGLRLRAMNARQREFNGPRRRGSSVRKSPTEVRGRRPGHARRSCGSNR